MDVGGVEGYEEGVENMVVGACLWGRGTGVGRFPFAFPGFWRGSGVGYGAYEGLVGMLHIEGVSAEVTDAKFLEFRGIGGVDHSEWCEGPGAWLVVPYISVEELVVVEAF